MLSTHRLTNHFLRIYIKNDWEIRLSWNRQSPQAKSTLVVKTLIKCGGGITGRFRSILDAVRNAILRLLAENLEGIAGGLN